MWIDPSLCEVEAIIESVWFECTEFEDPEILSFQEQMPCLFFRHIALRYFFDDYKFEVPIKVMAGFQEVLVYADGVGSFRVVPMFIYPLVGALRFHLPDVLSFVTFTAKAQIDCIPGLASNFMADFISFFPGSVSEV